VEKRRNSLGEKIEGCFAKHPFFLSEKKMQLQKILSILDSIAPFETSEQWDNVGLMVGDPRQEINSILVTLDPSFEAIETAQKANANLIVTHHPLIFTPLRRIDLTDIVSRKIGLLIQARIALLSMHTNLDIAAGGVADVLAGRLFLQDIKSSGPMRYGKIKKAMSLKAWSRSLPFDSIRIVDADLAVKNVCACPGSGMSYLHDSLSLGCDTLVTGDVKYHAALDALEAGINIVDLGHFATEQIAIAPFAERLRSEFRDLPIHTHQAKDVFVNIKGE
jgi:GTP cyclohydrolase I